MTSPLLVYFYPIFHGGLYCRAVSTADNFCTKKGNPSTFGPKIRNLIAVSNQERVIMAPQWYTPW